MDNQGYSRTMEILRLADIPVDIQPVPKDGEDVPNITVFFEGEERFVLAGLLNAFDTAGLTDRWHDNWYRGPRLKFISQTATSATFSDLSVKHPSQDGNSQNPY